MLNDRAEALVFPVSSPHFAAFVLHNYSASNLTSYQVLYVCSLSLHDNLDGGIKEKSA